MVVYYAVWWAGRWLLPVDDVPPSSLSTSLQSGADLQLYTGAEQNLAWVRSVIVRGLRLSAASVADVLAAVKEAWMSINSKQIGQRTLV